MIVITAAEGTFIGKYLSLYFNSVGMKKKFEAIKSGSTVPHLTCGEVRELLVPLPDLGTQGRIVAECEEIDASVQSLAKIYGRKLADLSALKESLLQQAFLGSLRAT
jgi:restriction endonuclease S subunit